MANKNIKAESECLCEEKHISFDEALKKLGIEKYGDRIVHSNSHGELFHLDQYVGIAESLTGDISWFAEWFDDVVEFAQKSWDRPESVFQHILKILIEMMNDE